MRCDLSQNYFPLPRLQPFYTVKQSAIFYTQNKVKIIFPCYGFSFFNKGSVQKDPELVLIIQRYYNPAITATLPSS